VIGGEAVRAGDEPRRRRLFFALWPDAATREAIVGETAAAVEASRGRAVPADNLHITLAFLGNVDSALASALLRLTPPSAGAFDLTLERLTFFRRARMLWFEPREVPVALAGLDAALWRTLEARFDCVREKRRFRPHMTLARKARPVVARCAPVHWRVDTLVLVESRPRDGGSAYTVVASWPLA
jgi:2'-5' RNA ligase